MRFRRGARLDPGQVVDARGSGGGSGMGIPVAAGGGGVGLVILIAYLLISALSGSGTSSALGPLDGETVGTNSTALAGPVRTLAPSRHSASAGPSTASTAVQTSTDPRAYYTDPPGSLVPAGEHKGYALGLAVEVLGGILSGTGAARAGKGPMHNGTMIVCLDVRRFLALDDFHDQVAALFGFVRSAPLAAGAREVLIPGEPDARMTDERRARGVPVEDETWRQIAACAEEAGVAVGGS